MYKFNNWSGGPQVQIKPYTQKGDFGIPPRNGFCTQTPETIVDSGHRALHTAMGRTSALSNNYFFMPADSLGGTPSGEGNKKLYLDNIKEAPWITRVQADREDRPIISQIRVGAMREIQFIGYDHDIYYHPLHNGIQSF